MLTYLQYSKWSPCVLFESLKASSSRYCTREVKSISVLERIGQILKAGNFMKSLNRSADLWKAACGTSSHLDDVSSQVKANESVRAWIPTAFQLYELVFHRKGVHESWIGSDCCTTAPSDDENNHLTQFCNELQNLEDSFVLNKCTYSSHNTKKGLSSIWPLQMSKSSLYDFPDWIKNMKAEHRLTKHLQKGWKYFRDMRQNTSAEPMRESSKFLVDKYFRICDTGMKNAYKRGCYKGPIPQAT